MEDLFSTTNPVQLQVNFSILAVRVSVNWLFESKTGYCVLESYYRIWLTEQFIRFSEIVHSWAGLAVPLWFDTAKKDLKVMEAAMRAISTQGAV
jgi:hypothetical protein